MSEPTGSTERPLTRRNVVRGVAVGGLALPLLAACGSDGADDVPPDASGDASGDGNGGTGSATVPTSDVPVGGGVILAEEMVVVTQPDAGEFKAFSAKCTHQGCPVQTVQDGRIGCNCHGSRFSIEDGSVVNGPASRPLESLSLTVEGDQVTVG
jgi:Rieske Fe-S protein